MTKSLTTIYIKWQPPPIGSYKHNTGRVTCLNTGIGGVGGVFRNNRGDWVLGYMKGLPHTTSIRSELQALCQGLKIALDHNLIPLEINIDFE